MSAPVHTVMYTLQYVIQGLQSSYPWLDHFARLAVRPPPWEREVGRRGCYPTVAVISKIGRYIATTIAPTTTPSTAIITGSIIATTASSATSTSSS